MPRILIAPGMVKCIGCYSCMLACARYVYNDFSPHESAIQVHTAGGMRGQMTADICRACPEPVPCVEACPAGALEVRQGGRGMLFREKKCTGCGLCVEACPVRVIYWDSETERPILCRFCGQCARYCPHDCLKMVEISELSQQLIVEDEAPRHTEKLGEV